MIKQSNSARRTLHHRGCNWRDDVLVNYHKLVRRFKTLMIFLSGEDNAIWVLNIVVYHYMSHTNQAGMHTLAKHYFLISKLISMDGCNLIFQSCLQREIL